MARGLLGFPLEQPLESIKTQWQAKPVFKSELQIAKDIYHTKGTVGFYAGSVPNIARVALKNLYRYPLMISLPSYFERVLPRLFGEQRNIQKLMTGLTIASIESFIMCPLERLKVLLMTQSASERVGLTGFYKQHKGTLSQELFRGMTMLAARQCMAWVSFLQADLVMKTSLRKFYNIPDDKSIPTHYLVAGSIFVALVNSFCVMPLDAMKTTMQKFDPLMSIRDSAKLVYKQAGFRGFFVGWRIRFTLYLLHAVFTVDLLERLETMTRNISRKNGQQDHAIQSRSTSTKDKALQQTHEP